MTKRLEAEINRAFYANDKYNLIATFVMVYYDKEISVEDMGKYVRATDRFIQIDESHCFIIFHYTAQENAYKASQNLLLKLDKHFQNSNAVIAIDDFDKSESPALIICKLKQIIKEIKKNSLVRVEDKSLLDSKI